MDDDWQDSVRPNRTYSERSSLQCFWVDPQITAPTTNNNEISGCRIRLELEQKMCVCVCVRIVAPADSNLISSDT